MLISDFNKVAYYQKRNIYKFENNKHFYKNHLFDVCLKKKTKNHKIATFLLNQMAADISL